jgi:excisionase family DNA binding protein
MRFGLVVVSETACGVAPIVRQRAPMTDFENRLVKVLTAPADQLEAIDKILAGKTAPPRREIKAPILLGMGASAELLGVSRATLWRMIKIGKLKKVEVLPGSFRLRRVDVEAIGGVNE